MVQQVISLYARITKPVCSIDYTGLFLLLFSFFGGRGYGYNMAFCLLKYCLLEYIVFVTYKSKHLRPLKSKTKKVCASNVPTTQQHRPPLLPIP